MDTPQDQIPRRIARLLTLYHLNLLSPGLHDELDNWVNASEENQSLFEQATHPDFLPQGYRFLESANKRKDRRRRFIWLKIKSASHRHVWMRDWRVAASVLLVIGAATLLYMNVKRTRTDSVVAKNKITNLPPGGNVADLTIGKNSIQLDKLENETSLPVSDGITITKKDGEIVYNDNGVIRTSTPQYHIITTPRGGTYAIKLADGTRIWLNAASSVKYPVSINNRERRVSITGEVYFEVAKLYSGEKKVPFYVDVPNKGITVEVLGTHFNINAYDDEPVVKTTLLEGKVSVTTNTDNKVLAPNQQADIVDDEIKIVSLKTTETEAAKAWQAGKIDFSGFKFGTVMHQIERWYDIEVKCDETTANKIYNVNLSRKDSLSSFMNIFKTYGYTCELEGRKLIIRQDAPGTRFRD